VFPRNQSEITRHLFATSKTVHIAR
jgi:hypothetical protein